MVRCIAIAVALALAACQSSERSTALGDDDDGFGQDPGAPVDCVEHGDCVAAGASCCECPTFALPASSGWESSCADVDCGAPADDATCSATVAACQSGACVLRCSAIACDITCPDRFAVDAFGCLLCECGGAAPGEAECSGDADCVQVPADCCGCAGGGTDTAVPTDRVDEFADALMCQESPSCPGVDVCDPAAAPQCVAGACRLGSGVGGGPAPDAGAELPPADLVRCGTNMLPDCASGEACVLNDPEAEDASAAGVGVCRPQ